MRILVIEDNSEIQRYYSRGLERKETGFDIVESRVEAVQKLKRRSYEGAIVDLQLTEDESYSQGIEVLRYIRAVNEGTKAMVVSATPNVQDIIDSYEVGAVKVISKGDKSYAEIAEDFADACKKVTLRNFGEFRSLNAYLASPDTVPIWEDAVQRVLRCGYPSMQKTIRTAFSKYLPILRLSEFAESMSRDETRGMVFGTFWSKAKGFPFVLAISRTEIQAEAPVSENAVEIDNYSPIKGVYARTWKLLDIERDGFPEFVHDLPWVK